MCKLGNTFAYLTWGAAVTPSKQPAVTVCEAQK